MELRISLAVFRIPKPRIASLALGSAVEEKAQKKSAREASRAVVWGGERVAEPVDMPLMLLFHDITFWYHALIGEMSQFYRFPRC